MTKKRPRIFVLHAALGSLQPTSGDRIETIRFMTTLNQFADVYYNGMRFDPTRPDLGLADKDVEFPQDSYDLYYIRANHEFFRKIPGPKITMAYPYDPEIFAQADAILVTTAEWKRLLETFNENGESRKKLAKWYPSRHIATPKRLVNIRQTIAPHFESFKPSRVSYYRALMTNGRAFGYFGRVTEESLPHLFLSQLTELRKSHGDLVTVVGGNIRAKLSNDIINIRRIPYDDMPNVVRACFALLANEERDAEFLGSGKVLEGIATGVPIVTKMNPVRVEQLGADYPLFYNNAEESRKVTDDLLSNPATVRKVAEILDQRRHVFSLESQGRFVEQGLGPLIR